MPAAAAPTSGGSAEPTPAGWDIDGMEAALRQQRPAMAYLVPDFHNPTGRLMSDLQRRRLVARRPRGRALSWWWTRRCGS